MNYSFIEIAWMFLSYSIIGWIWESTFVSIKEKKCINRGFLRGPIIPIYGFAVTTVMLSMSLIDTYLTFHLIVNTLLAMAYIALIATSWEYVTSLVMEVLFKTRWWNYSNHRFNLAGRIALDASVFWGLSGFVLWRFINVPVLQIYETLKGPYFNGVLAFAYVLVTIDTGFTVFELINLRNIVIKLHKASEEVVSQLSIKIEHLSDNIETISENVTENILEQRQNFVYKIAETKETIKTLKKRAQYRKYEGFQYFGDFLDDMVSKWKNWLNESDHSLTLFDDLLRKVKTQSRFFRNYPNASTKLFELMYALRKQDDANETNETNLNEKDTKKDGSSK